MARRRKTAKAEKRINVADNNFLLNNNTEIATVRLNREFTEPHKKMGFYFPTLFLSTTDLTNRTSLKQRVFPK